MKRCYKCNSKIIKAELIDIRGRIYTALVCTYCGHLYSKDKPFKKEWKFRAG